MGILRTDTISGLETPTPVTGSVYFDGDARNDNLNMSADYGDLDFQNTDFTFESWVYPTDMSIDRYWCSKGDGNLPGTAMDVRFDSDGQINISFYVSSTGYRLNTAVGVLRENVWSHVAVVRNGTSFKSYVNGKETSSATHNITVSDVSATFKIGILEGVGTGFKGYMSDFRFVRGKAVYIGEFTPSIYALEPIDGTVLLCCNNPDSAGAEATGKTITVNGDAVASTFSPGLTRDFTYGTQFDGVSRFDTQGYFVPPSGTTEQRFPNFVAVPDSSARGVSVGGLTDDSTNVIEYITISTTGNSQDFGDLQQKRSLVSGASSNVRGIVVGGYISPGSNTNTIEYTTIASTGNAQYFGELNLTSNGAQSCSNSTRAVFNKGQTKTLGYVTIASMGNALDFGTLVNVAKNQPGALSSTTRGIWGGGTSPSPNVTAIDFVTIATTGDAVNFGDLTEAKHGLKGFSSSTRGVWGGGDLSPTISNVIEYITIASLGNSQNFGDLTVARRNSGATSSKTRGVWMGADYSPTSLNVIDYVTIATTGDAVDFGNLITAKGGGAFSNAHGGLA